MRQRTVFLTLVLILIFSLACGLQLPGQPTVSPVPPTATPTPTAWPLPPAVVEALPPPGSQISLQDSLTIYFSEPMERASVEAALRSPEASALLFDWLDDATLTVKPLAPFAADAEIHFVLGPQARTAYGLSLPHEVTLTYRTPGLLTVSQILPAPQAEAVSPDSAVVVTFNQPVTPLGADAASLPVGFTLEPIASGRGAWLNTSTYIFYPDPGLAGGVDYTVRVNPALRSAAGTPLDSASPNLAWAFRTALPEVLSISPKAGALIGLTPQFEVTFNQPMDSTSVEAAFDLRAADGRTTPGEFTWNERGTVLTFSLSGGELARASDYQLTLGAASRSRGGAPLGQDVQARYTTYGAFQFEGANILDGGLRFEALVLSFGAPLYVPQGVELSELLQISPAISYFYASAQETEVSIYGDFAAGETYTLTLPASLSDQWGQTLGQPQQFTFHEPDAQPRLEYSSYNLELFARPADPVVSLQAVNLQTIDVSRGTLTLDDFLRLRFDYDWQKNFVPADNETWRLTPNLPRNLNQPVEVRLSEGPLAPGLYWVKVNRPDDGRYSPRGRLLVVSDINVTVKASADEALVWALDLRSREPVRFASIRLFNDKGEGIASGKTDVNGLWRAALPGGQTLDTVVVGQPGEEQFGVGAPNWSDGIRAWDFDLSYDGNPPRTMGYMYTDRPIYRPGDAVSFRGILRTGYDGRYSASEITKVSLALLGPDGLLAEREIRLSEFGSFDGQFNLPDQAAPGWYNILVELDDNQWLPGGDISFQVADYRKPEIDLAVQIQPVSARSVGKNEASNGDALTGVVRASYFFGAPVADLPFQWALYVQPTRFELPSFDTGLYTDTWLSLGEDSKPLYRSGEGRTDADGRFVIPLEALEVNETSIATLEVTATESGGFPVSASATLTLHPETFYIGVRPQAWFGQAGSPLRFDLLTVDWEQTPLSQPLQAEFKKVRWERQDLGAWYTFKPIFTPFKSQPLTTSPDGRGEVTFTPAEAGTYALEVTGEHAKTQVLVWVGGAENATWPNLPYDQLRLITDQETYQPGETAEIFIPNPFNETAQALLTTERGTIKTAEVLSIPPQGYRFHLPLTLAAAPNLYVSVTLLGPGANFKQGFVNLQVDPTALTLNVELKATPEKASPGDTLTLDLTVTDQQGQPVQGEFSLAVVDLAVLALAGPNSQEIVPAYYSVQPLGVSTGLTDAIYARRLSGEVGGQGGGGGTDILTIREDFPDTAYWKANLLTDAQGKAQVSLTLPDSLTTWQVESRGLTQDTLVGQASLRVVSSKDLLIRPQTPRFLVIGDRAELAAIVNNTSAQEQQATVTLTADGFQLDEGFSAEQTLTIPANGRARVSWRGVVGEIAAIDAVFAVKSASFQDAARPNDGAIPVLRYTAAQTFSTSGILTEATPALTEIIAVPRSFQPLGGELTLELSPSLASAILSALESRTLPDSTWSVEQILSYLLPNVVTYQTLQSVGVENPALRARLDRDLREGVTRLLTAQFEDGGWPWALHDDRSDVYLTAYVTYGLERVRQCGLLGEDAALLAAIQHGRAYLFSTADPFTGVADLSDPQQANRAAFYTFVLQETGGLNNFGYLVEELYGERERLEPWAAAMLSATLARQDASDGRVKTLISDLEATARRTASGAHWESAQGGWGGRLPGSSLYTSAIVLYTLTERDPASPLAADAARYLASQRGARGWWGSAYEDAWIILALDRFMAATGEFRAAFDFSANLNGVTIAQGQAAGPQNLTTVTSATPLNQMMLNGANQLILNRQAGVGRLYYRAALTVLRPAESAPALNQGIAVSREYLQCDGEDCHPVDSYQMRTEAAGRVTVRLTVTLANDGYYFMLEDYVPAGAEILDPALKTSQQGQESQSVSVQYDPNDPFSAGWGWWYFNHPRLYPERIEWSADYLPAGTYILTYTLIPSLVGEYRALPAHAWLTYFPEVQGSSAGAVFKILGAASP